MAVRAGSQAGVRARSMKITIVTGPSYPVPAVSGGAMSKAWELLAPEFAARGHEVVVLTRRHGRAAAPAPGANPRMVATWGFAQSRSLAFDLARDLAYATSLVPKLPRADVLVCNDFWLPAIAPWLTPAAGRVFICAARQPKRQYRLYRRDPRVIALSRAVAAAIAAQEPRLGPRTAVIPLPVDLDLFRQVGPPPPRPGRVLQYVGRVHPEKGVHLLVRAFVRLAEAHPGWRLRIIGPIEAGQGGGGGAYIDELHAIAAGSLAVQFTGPVFDRAALARAYADADLICYPSLAEHGEAFGVVPLEGMAAGVPPVVSRLACFEDFVHDGDNGWVFDHRAADPVGALADVLDLAMRDDAERRRRGALGRAQAERHSVPWVAQRYLEEFALP